ncbi:PP2C family protein-serine/threonine phosphatase [Roseimaritima ulvae]|uniref:Serine/threonine phosphatase stp n=1 Tax=Roseimaritima ulvae TaxID=980254 RepID=A0A5B9QKS7_9BACT|nr:protein phosphatase 2C domain-containing protein [Roseimaritima ulvae]QEG39678.1 Serine/threonine phosphatase stp [Roseimaritima ulvae]
MSVKIDCSGATDTGRVRKNNQDQFLIAELKKSMLVQACSLPLEQQSRLFGNAQGHLLLVADGMGGHAAGERASELAVDYMIQRLLNSVHWFFRLEDDVEKDFLLHLQNLLQEAHQRILDDGVVNVENRGMGTTLTMAYAIWPRLYVVHAGDTRCYLIRDGQAECMTRDHTLARQLVESGGMRPEEEAESRWSNVLWNVLGGHGDGDITVEVSKATLQVGDAIMLCSDGLYRYLDEPAIADIVSRASSAAAACDELIRLANLRGGEDNITAVVGRYPRPLEASDLDDDFVAAPRDPSDEDTKPQGG